MGALSIFSVLLEARNRTGTLIYRPESVKCPKRVRVKRISKDAFLLYSVWYKSSAFLSPPLYMNPETTSCCLLRKTFFSHCQLDISSCLKLGHRYHLLILTSLDQPSRLRFWLEWQTRSQLLLKKA